MAKAIKVPVFSFRYLFLVHSDNILFSLSSLAGENDEGALYVPFKFLLVCFGVRNSSAQGVTPYSAFKNHS